MDFRPFFALHIIALVALFFGLPDKNIALSIFIFGFYSLLLVYLYLFLPLSLQYGKAYIIINRSTERIEEKDYIIFTAIPKDNTGPQDIFTFYGTPTEMSEYVEKTEFVYRRHIFGNEQASWNDLSHAAKMQMHMKK